MNAIDAGSIILAHLQNPTEKFWGVLLRLDPIGVQLRGLNVSSFDDWLSQAVSGETPTLAPATMFIPLARVERLFLDEEVGAVESYSQRFARRVGLTVEEYLGIIGPGGTEPS